MRNFCLVTLLLCGPAVVLRADFMYQETTQMTGGSMMTMMRALGPLTGRMREPIAITHLLKGNRMATVAKDQVTVIDLDKEAITTIDNAKKTYSVMTFAEMKQAMEDAAKKMEGRKNDKGDDVKASFKVSAKATGQTKTVQGLNAKQMILTMTMEGKNTKTGEAGGMDMVSDFWYAPIPGYEEVKAFQKKMAIKMGYMFGSGMEQMSRMASAQQPGMSQNMEELAKEMAKIDGVPVESVMRMGGNMTATNASGETTTAQTAAQPAPKVQPKKEESAASALAGAALGRFGGFGRKKSEPADKPAEPAQRSEAPAQAAGPLMEMTTTLTGFNSASVDGSRLEVPAGYKQLDKRR